MELDVPKLVKEFNNLPRPINSASETVPNYFHFDIRYIPVEPPSHVIFFFHSGNRSFEGIHQESLPISIEARETEDTDYTGPQYKASLTFFPETGQDAAPEVANALLYYFATARPRKRGDDLGIAPWKLTTECPALAKATNTELEPLGVRPECRIVVAPQPLSEMSHEMFGHMFKTVFRSAFKVTESIFELIATPASILFEHRMVPCTKHWEHGEAEAAIACAIALTSARPHQHATENPKSLKLGEEDRTKVVQETKDLLNLLETKSETTLRSAADAGDAVSALDYALRLRFGLRCTPDRKSERDYLVKAIQASNAGTAIKATAHALLISWTVGDDGTLHKDDRHVLTACHHAEMAAMYSAEICSSANAARAVLNFLSVSVDAIRKRYTEVYLLKNVMRVLQKRDRQLKEAQSKANSARLPHPNPKYCATLECGDAPSPGEVFMRCSGKCDKDKKPRYCTRECQQEDWSNHKPFCRPGAECSVLDE